MLVKSPCRGASDGRRVPVAALYVFRTLIVLLASSGLLLTATPASAEESTSVMERFSALTAAAPSDDPFRAGHPVSTLDTPLVDPQAVAPGLGDAIAGFAVSYQGYPYVWAGNGPGGFDCSGFTEWVILNIVGVDIGHDLQSQPYTGYWVDYGAWQPGDLVFFQNTYKAGLSHAGVYIGDGLFIHAENESTGVVITSIYSDYYGSRYWGATRVG